MGTRHLICVVKDEEYKVAQYGQWDGYPDGQGADVLQFLRENNHNEFSQKVSKLSFASDEAIHKVWKDCGAGDSEFVSMDVVDAVEKIHPELSRNTGAGILNLIMNFDPINILLNNELIFAKDSLFCEWCYVIDLDKNTFEVFEGFNKRRLSKNARFYFDGESNEDGYYPVRKVIEFSLSDLPSKEDFLNNFRKKDDEK